jgi:hypothetical protein
VELLAGGCFCLLPWGQVLSLRLWPRGESALHRPRESRLCGNVIEDRTNFQAPLVVLFSLLTRTSGTQESPRQTYRQLNLLLLCLLKMGLRYVIKVAHSGELPLVCHASDKEIALEIMSSCSASSGDFATLIGGREAPEEGVCVGGVLCSAFFIHL